jgi:hypothetical protein
MLSPDKTTRPRSISSLWRATHSSSTRKPRPGAPNLPDATKQYETPLPIRAPRFDPLANGRYSFVSKELSWATDNRLLEMRSRLSQPFLYYAIHRGYLRDPNHYPDVIAPGTRANFPRNILNDPARSFSPRDAKILQTMIAFGIEANPKIIEVRGLRPPSSRAVVRSAVNHDSILAPACVRQKQQRGPNT